MTLLYHINHPWQVELSDETYYFCQNPDCDVVYFAKPSIRITQTDLRTTIGLKTDTNDATICYCFGITRADASKATKDFVIAQTKASTCSCETVNPSGRCCLKNFPKY